MPISDHLKQNRFCLDNKDTSAHNSTEENLGYHSLAMSCVVDDLMFWHTLS
jgi:hypothetical protein